MSSNLNNSKFLKILFLLLFCLVLSSCKKEPPQNVENICSIFKQYPKWYWDAQSVEKHWDLPIPVLMAIIYQESKFNASAKPPRRKLLYVIPWTRPTSAYGYSQALKTTWGNYKKNDHHTFVSRDSFSDAADFIGWYSNVAHRKAHISKSNAYQLYLAYHEGIGGYSRRTYLKKKWLIYVAMKVQTRSMVYDSQLKRCKNKLPRKPFWRI